MDNCVVYVKSGLNPFLKTTQLIAKQNSIKWHILIKNKNI